MSAPTVSIVIVTWNSAPVIESCLRSIAAHPPPAPHEIVVVDNASTDGTVAVVTETAPTTRVIRNPTNRGLPAANNQGIEATTGELLLISNPDVQYQAGAIEALVDVVARHERAGFVVPRHIGPDGLPRTSVGDLPRLREALAGRAAAARRCATTGFWWDGWAHDTEREVGRGHEAAYLVRRTAIDDIGPQDERYSLDWEGIDWTARLRARGWQVWFTPAAVVVHQGGASIRQAQARWIVQSHRGMYNYFADRRTRLARPILAALISARALAKLAALAARRDVYR